MRPRTPFQRIDARLIEGAGIANVEHNEIAAGAQVRMPPRYQPCLSCLVCHVLAGATPMSLNNAVSSPA